MIPPLNATLPFCPKLAWLGKMDSSERTKLEAQPLRKVGIIASCLQSHET